MANRGATFDAICNGALVTCSMKHVRGVENSILIGGIDFDGRFGSVWDEPSKCWKFSSSRSSNHAFQVWNAVNDFEFEVIRAYLNNPDFDWSANRFVLNPEERV